MRHYGLKVLMFSLLALAISACTEADKPKLGGNAPASSAKAVDIGNILFTEAAWPTYAVETLADPIRLPQCHLTVLDRADMPSKEDGTIEWLGVEVKDGEKVEERDLIPNSHAPGRFRRLRLGDRVSRDHVIAQLNDDRALLEVDIAYSNIKGAEAQLAAAAHAIQYYVENLAIEIKAQTSTSNIVGARASLAKAESEKAAKEWDVKRTEGEKKKADEKLKNHFMRAPITGDVVQIFKQKGEGVKASDPVLEIQNTDKLQVEGPLEVQYARRVADAREVYLEPAVMEPPQPWRSPHASSRPIAAVAAGMRDGKQVIISASEDGSVCVWDRGAVYATWKHSGPVRALAVTRPECNKSLVLTGCDDGKARLWPIGETGQKPLLILEGQHEGGVQAAAFAPDGDYCVTADDRGNIFLYETATGKRIYQFPSQHTGSVSSLVFTKQCRVISTGRDNVVHIWKVGSKNASVETSFDRSGEVTNLGVSDDGGQMCLDLDKNRLRIISLKENRSLATFQQSADSKFSGFALFSPVLAGDNDRLLLTAGNTDGVLQLWRWTSGPGRGSELKKLVCTGYAPANCAAFSPLAKDGFVVAGTRKGDVFVWPLPNAEEMNNRYKAQITHIDENLESSGRTVRVLAELANPADPALHLRPGMTATMVVPQK